MARVERAADIQHQGPFCNARSAEHRTLITQHQFVTEEKRAAARRHRKSPTDAERRVWAWLRGRRMLGLKWRRQQVIAGFIADLYCAEHHLAIEIDGGVHESEDARVYDRERGEIFVRKGIRTIRVSNDDCTEDVLRAILEQWLLNGGTA